jgi:hypothetical protein
MTDKIQPENLEYFNYFDSMIANGARCTRDIKSRIVMAKVAFNKKEDSFQHNTGLTLKESTSRKLYLEHNFIWCSNLDTSDSRSEITGKFWNVVLETDEEDKLDRTCEKEEVLQRQKDRNILQTIKRRKANWTGHT